MPDSTAVFYPQHLLQPFSLGPVRLRNRLLAAPIVTGLEHHRSVDALLQFWLPIARSGFGLICIAAGVVNHTGRAHSQQCALKQADLPRHRTMTQAIQSCGCKVVLQLLHAGPSADHVFAAAPHFGHLPSVSHFAWRATDIRLRGIISDYAHAAEFARQAGYDGVEINAAGQGLLAAFLSQISNQRKDMWGANQLARFKLSLDVVRAVRKQIGPSPCIGFRFNLLELHPQGFDWTTVLRLVSLLRNAGVDYLCADFGGFQSRVPTDDHCVPVGLWNSTYSLLAQNVALPVVFGHNVGSLDTANALAQTHSNALFEFGEELLGDQDFLWKALGLNRAALQPWIFHQNTAAPNSPTRSAPDWHLCYCPSPTRCTTQTNSQPTKKKVAVIGGGITGIYFSLFAAQFGHQIELFEMQNQLGGQCHFLSKIALRQNLLTYINCLENYLQLAKVKVHLGVDASSINKSTLNNFDQLVTCRGVEVNYPDIAGIDSSNVLGFDEICRGGVSVGNRVAVLGINPIALSICRYLLDTTPQQALSVDIWRNTWGIGSLRDHPGGVLGVIPTSPQPLRRIVLIETHPGQLHIMREHPYYKWIWKWLQIRGVQTIEGGNIELIDNHSVRMSTGIHHTERFAIRVDHVVVCAGFVRKEDPLGVEIPIIHLGGATDAQGFLSLQASVAQAMKAAQKIT